MLKRLLVSLMLVLGLSAPCFAGGISFPMETKAVGIWLPDSGGFGGGVAHTVASYDVVDLQIVVAKEVVDAKEGMWGIGLSVDVLDLVRKVSQSVDIKLLSDVGVCLLNDFNEFRRVNDIVDNVRLAVYGTLLTIRW